MQFTYQLDDRPPLADTIVLGLQWFAIAIPTIIILGKISGGFHFKEPLDQIIYLQKITFVMGAALLAQIAWGHRLPLIIGPSTILLIGILSSRGHDPDTIYSAVLIGGAALSIASITGLFRHMQRLFTPRVVSVVLLLIAFTLSPAILKLITAAGNATGHLLFAFALSISMFVAYRTASGFFRLTLIVWSMVLGSVVYLFLFPRETAAVGHAEMFSFFFNRLTLNPAFDAGVIISFLFCFVALSINDLGSIQSLNELLKPGDMGGRVTRGIFVTGCANIMSGLFGVIGPVNFSLSPGVITSTGCASRVPLFATSLLLLLISWSPAVIGFMGNVPSVVIGSVMIYILCSQIGVGLTVAFEDEKPTFEDGLVIGLPILLGTIVAFLPTTVLFSLPTDLRPVMGNGFIVGMAAAMILEHLVFRRRGV